MSKSNTTENDVIKLIFLGTDPSWRDISGQANFYLALHTADPTESGIQTNSEVAYTSYARVPVARTAGGWTVAGNQASNAAQLQFPKCTGLTTTARYVSIGLGDTGVGGQIIYSGQLSSDLDISNNIQPQFASPNLVITED
jgi:hypothetical protein